MSKKPMADVIVILPGITGSVLEKDGREKWALSAEAGLQALLTLGNSIKDLKLERDPPEVDDLGDGVRASRVMPDAHLFPGLWKIDGYTKVVERILQLFSVERGRNFIEFPYDWRRDNRVAARRLQEESRRWLREWRESSGNANAKLILVGHSMGGLVSRYFVEVLEGWRDTSMLITFGTPYRGSLNAVDTLSNGARKLMGLIDLTELTRSFTSIYQLLPIYPCYEGGSGDLVHLTEAEGIPGLDPQRVKAADEFHREIERAVERHLDDAEYRESRYAIHPIVGLEQPTNQSARLVDGRLDLLRSRGGLDEDGDGTVPRVSATPIELGDDPPAVFAATRHASLQNADPVLVQVRGVLDRIKLGGVRAAAPISVSVDIEDVYRTDEPVVLEASPSDPGELLEAVIQEVGSGREVARTTLAPAEGWRRAEFGPLPQGGYRAVVSGSPMVEPVSDLFLVA